MATIADDMVLFMIHPDDVELPGENL